MILDYIEDETVRELLSDLLAPSNEIMNQLNAFKEGTALEFAMQNPDANNPGTLRIKYVVDHMLSLEEINEINDKKDLLDELDFPFTVRIEVYEPKKNPVITKEVYTK